MHLQEFLFEKIIHSPVHSSHTPRHIIFISVLCLCNTTVGPLILCGWGPNWQYVFVFNFIMIRGKKRPAPDPAICF